MLRYLTAGESHGEALMAILEGLPGGLRVDKGKIDQDLASRQAGYGCPAGLRRQNLPAWSGATKLMYHAWNERSIQATPLGSYKT